MKYRIDWLGSVSMWWMKICSSQSWTELDGVKKGFSGDVCSMAVLYKVFGMNIFHKY